MIALWMVYATVVATLFGAAAALVERTSSGQPSRRRWVWLLALALAVSVPVGTAIAPRARQTADSATATASAPVSATTMSDGLAHRLSALMEAVEPSALGRFDSALTIAWAIAAVLALAGYGIATWSLAKRRRSWRPARVDGHDVLLAPGIGPAVVGALRPRIVVPEWSLDLAGEQRSLMLEHEQQHVRARDPLLLHSAAMFGLLMPWNVGLWWLNRRLRLAVELDCDARVLSAGRDARAYGTLLLDVCSRRARPGALLAPALLERTSSLAKRILAMQPAPRRFSRIRTALGIAAACAVVAAACEMPTPEMLAPDGKNAVSKRLYGRVQTASAQLTGQPREIVARYFPAIARGEGGPAILFIVKSATGEVVLTESQPAEFARMPAEPSNASPSQNPLTAAPVRVPREGDQRRMRARMPAGDVEVRDAPGNARPGVTLLKTRREGSAMALPTGVGALRPEDIASIDVSKHAAGAVAPKPVSIITIVLGAGARVPTSSTP